VLQGAAAGGGGRAIGQGQQIEPRLASLRSTRCGPTSLGEGRGLSFCHGMGPGSVGEAFGGVGWRCPAAVVGRGSGG
jgi:hypothetical protein